MKTPSPRALLPSRIQSWLLLNLLLLGVVGALSASYPVEELSRRLGDIYFRLRPPLPTSQSVALVLIDDLSLTRYGRWPWPRALLARLVRGAAREKPTAIGLDVLLSEPGDPRSDDDLATSLGDAGNVVLSAKVGTFPQNLWSDPLPIFLSKAAAIGHVQAVEDADGICRSIPLRELSLDGPRLALAVEVARISRHLPLEQPSREQYTRAGVGWETYPPEFLTIDFRKQSLPGQSDPPFTSVSAEDVLEGRAQPALAGKAVLIGFAATELSDRLPTPVSEQTPMPGVEVHANLLDGLLSGRNLQPAQVWPQVLFVVAFSLLSTWLVLRWPLWTGILLQTALLAASYAAGYWIFAHAHRMIAFGPILCAGLLAVPLAQLENLVVVNRGLTRGLRQLRLMLQTGRSQQEGSIATPPTRSETSGDLRWRMELVNGLQAELGSLYAFRQNLLESMQEGLAVFTADGKTLFRNRCWDTFCRNQGWDPAMDLGEFGRVLGHPAWVKVEERVREEQANDASSQRGSSAERFPLESEVPLKGAFWQVRGVRLRSTIDTGSAQWMVVVTDLTSSLERDQARADALRFVTHELLTPLVAIQGFAEFLMHYPESQRSSDAAATIFRESQRLVSLINTYLDVLRFDAGARSMRREPISISSMVAQVQRVMSPIAEAAEIRIAIGVDSSLPLIEGDAPMLTGVLLNLLNNAVKYSPAGSEVALHVTATNASVSFEVRNPGPAIPPDDLRHLFEPFYRTHAADASKPGWGLGLTFVKRIVEEHEGTLAASSDETGICVRVTLPACPPLESSRIDPTG